MISLFCTYSLQFPECSNRISIACLNLKYSVPFSHKKYRETKNYDVNPLVLPMCEECDDMDDGVADDCSNRGNDEAGIVDNCTTTVTTNDDDNVVLSERMCVFVCLSVCLHVCVCLLGL